MSQPHHQQRGLAVQGGTEHLGNLQLLRGACDGVKGQQSQENFLARLADRGVLAEC
ncbi:MAG: hypothetical protein OXP73_03395 [Chloroflexota bacterium]|nr:hypothetical protein [Chloroflexota bacterium]